MLSFKVATGNAGKLREFREILSPLGIELSSVDTGVEETGSTFAENALLKAREGARLTGLPTIADDSGLVVEALGGAPGIYSARYGGEACKSDSERCELLIGNMRGITDRRAKFVCAIAAVFPDGRVLAQQGECAGMIADIPQGTSGFGYDPIFYLPELHMTMAQLTHDMKNTISHRAKALGLFVRALKGALNGQ